MLRRSLLTRGALLCLPVLLVACTARGGDRPTPSVSGATTSASALSRDDGWRADLDGLLPAAAAMHPDLAGGVPASLTAMVGRLRAQVPTLDDDELMVGVMQLARQIPTSGRDGHTGLYVWGEGNRPVHSLPLRLWFFSDGLYVEDQLGGRALVGSRIVGIAGRPLAAVLRRIDPLVPRDNAWTLALLRPRFLLIPEVLHGVGLLQRAGPVPLDVVRPDGRRSTVVVDPVAMARYNDWAGLYGLQLVPQSHLAAPDDDVLWHSVLRGGHALYVGYESVQELPPGEVAAIARLAASRAVDRVVVDVRRNVGGQVGADSPLLDVLTGPDVARPGRLFLLTGRNTFSAAAMFVARLTRQAPVVVVGEPMGGAPTAYGNSEDLRLPHSGLVLSVSTTRDASVSATDHRQTIVADLRVPLTSREYFRGEDPVLAAALDDARQSRG